MPSSLRLVLPFALLLVAAGARAAPGVRVGPSPVWVERQEVATTAPGGSGHDGIAFLLVDDQVRLGPEGAEHYNRLVQQVVGPAGTSEASELRINFDPTYQAVALHEVTIVRGGARLPALRPAEIKLIQREEELNKRIYDGRVTAVVFLRDVRVGDVVDAAWTVRGVNPVFGGRFSGAYDLGWSVPAARAHFRLLHPASRTLAFRVHGLELEPRRAGPPGWTDLRFTRAPAPGTQVEEELPPGVDAQPWLEVSEWPSWEAVVRWAAPLYQAVPPAGPEIEADLAAWRALPTEEARARAALRFVQDEIRYLGIELGEGSHQPTPPREVLARRFGDCKDKSLLLVSLLRALGIEASPALVNTEVRDELARRLPSPSAFDHVIVRARVDGAVRWLEPTRTFERARLEAVAPLRYAWALVLAPGTSALERLPPAVATPFEVTSTWRIGAWSQPADFTVVTTYRGLAALGMRDHLAQTPAAELQRHYLDHYAHDDPGISVAGPLAVEDAPDADLVVVTERYRLPPIAEGTQRDFSAEAVDGQLNLPRTAIRTLPLAVAHPVHVKERLEVELPGPPAIDPDHREIASGAVRLSRTARAEGRRYVVDIEYRSLAGAVPAGEVAGHLAKVREMRNVASYAVTLAAVRLGASGGRGDWGALSIGLGLLALMALPALIGHLRERRTGAARGWLETFASRRSWRARASAPDRPGTTPYQPLVVATEAEVGARALALICRCGAPHDPAGVTVVPVRLGAQELRALRAACVRCGEITRTYFAIAGPG